MSRFKVTKTIDFCYGHRLLDYNGKCANLHGHNGLLEVDVTSDGLDELGMVVDFNRIRDVVKVWVDANLDHKMLLWRRDPVVPGLQALNEPLFLLDVNPTAENICKLVYDQARRDGLPVSEVRLWETATGQASYAGE